MKYVEIQLVVKAKPYMGESDMDTKIRLLSYLKNINKGYPDIDVDIDFNSVKVIY